MGYFEACILDERKVKLLALFYCRYLEYCRIQLRERKDRIQGNNGVESTKRAIAWYVYL